MASITGALLRAMRPRQWTKNLILYAGLLFTLNEKWTPLSSSMWAYGLRASAAFLLFCLLSSGIYIINDLADIERDRLHPTKRGRPLASGALPVPIAAAAALSLIAASLVCSYLLRPLYFLVCIGYMLMQLGYSLSFKHMVILDVLVVSVGFVLRAVGGAIAIHVDISPWLYIVTLLGALFLGLCKRRHELLLLGENGASHRATLTEYSAGMLDQMIGIVAASTIMAYSLYTFTSPRLPGNHLMMLTIPLVLYGMLRYLYLVHSKDAGGSPEDVLLRDRPLIASIVLWVLLSAGILFLSRR